MNLVSTPITCTWYLLCNASEVRAGMLYSWTGGGAEVVLWRSEDDNQVYAVDAYSAQIVTHLGGATVD